MEKPTETEKDIIIAGTRLFDYFRDLIILSGGMIRYDSRYQAARVQFGEAILQLVWAVREDDESRKAYSQIEKTQI